MSRNTPLSMVLVLALSTIASGADVDVLLREWFDGPDPVHQAVQLHENEPLSKTAKQIRPILMAHFKQVDYVICGAWSGPPHG